MIGVDTTFLVQLELVELPAQESVPVAERLRRRLEQESKEGNLPEGVSVTASVGVSAVQPDDTGSTAMIKRADHALYRAKQTGRNRACM